VVSAERSDMMRMYRVRKNKDGNLEMTFIDGMSAATVRRDNIGLYETKPAALMAYQGDIDTEFAKNDEARKAITLDQFKLHELMSDLA